MLSVMVRAVVCPTRMLPGFAAVLEAGCHVDRVACELASSGTTLGVDDLAGVDTDPQPETVRLHSKAALRSSLQR